jgi:hypothetical protein
LHCTFIPATENRGYNAGNNIGLRYAAEKGYKYALIANPDMEFPQTDYLKKMVEVMERDKFIEACGSDILDVGGLHQNPMQIDSKSWVSSFNWMIAAWGNKKRGSYNNVDNYKANHYCEKLSGCCLMIRLADLMAQNYFDEQVFLYCEEAIFSRQVKSNNKKMFYLADVTALHVHVKRQKGNPAYRVKDWIASRLYFERKYNYYGRFNYYMKWLGWNAYLSFFRLLKG